MLCALLQLAVWSSTAARWTSCHQTYTRLLLVVSALWIISHAWRESTDADSVAVIRSLCGSHWNVLIDNDRQLHTHQMGVGHFNCELDIMCTQRVGVNYWLVLCTRTSVVQGLVICKSWCILYSLRYFVTCLWQYFKVAMPMYELASMTYHDYFLQVSILSHYLLAGHNTFLMSSNRKLYIWKELMSLQLCELCRFLWSSWEK